jgi:uncharacterized ferritin-like protein (DUF455 family)
MYVARKLTNRSLPVIGHYTGGRDHTTVLHATKAVYERLSAVTEEGAATVEAIRIIEFNAQQLAAKRRIALEALRYDAWAETYAIEHDDGPPPELLEQYIIAIGETD